MVSAPAGVFKSTTPFNLFFTPISTLKKIYTNTIEKKQDVCPVHVYFGRVHRYTCIAPQYGEYLQYANIICDCKSKWARKKGRGVCPCKSAGKTCSPSCNCSFEKCQNKNTATENRPERKSTSQPEAEELQFFTAEVRLPETETQQEVLEIITAMANRETQENLCRSEVTQIYVTEQRRTERTVPLGSPKSKQSSEFDASKNQPNLPDLR